MMTKVKISRGNMKVPEGSPVSIEMNPRPTRSRNGSARSGWVNPAMRGGVRM